MDEVVRCVWILKVLLYWEYVFKSVLYVVVVYYWIFVGCDVM